MLAMADLHLVVQKKGAADAVLPSKLTNILSAGGQAVVTAEPHTELGKIASNHPGIYTCIEPENATSLANAIEHSVSKLKDGDYNEIARKFALDNLQKDEVINRFLQEIHTRFGFNINNLNEIKDKEA